VKKRRDKNSKKSEQKRKGKEILKKQKILEVLSISTIFVRVGIKVAFITSIDWSLTGELQNKLTTLPSWAQCYKTLYVRNLWIFVIS